MIPPRTLVIIPAYNEEESLPAVLKELAEQTPEYDVLVVSDGSTDRTAEIAREAGVHVAVLPFNLGIGGALRTGFSFAVRHGYERAVQFDADGQHDPLALGALLDGLDAGADMVIGSRFAEGGAVTYEVSGIRRRAMRLLEWLVSVLVRSSSPTPARASAPSRARCSSTSRSTTRSSTWTRSRRWCRRATPASASRRCPPTCAAAPAARRRPRRFKLVYYYVRLLVVLVVSTTSRGQRARRVARRSQDS